MKEYAARLEATRAIVRTLVQDQFFQTSVPIAVLCQNAGVDLEDVEDLLPRRNKSPKPATGPV